MCPRESLFEVLINEFKNIVSFYTMTVYLLFYYYILHTGCSGNGVCVTDSSCQSRCRCRGRWQGQCCDRRQPIRTWGDPHLETLDG